MSFDDRLRDELRRATESQPLDAERRCACVRIAAEPPTASRARRHGRRPAGGGRHRRAGTASRTQRIVGVAAAIALIVGALALPLRAPRRRAPRTGRNATHDAAPPDQKGGRHRKPNLGRALQAVRPRSTRRRAKAAFTSRTRCAETARFEPTTHDHDVPERSAAFTRRTTASYGLRCTEAPGTAERSSCAAATAPNRNVTTTGDATVNVSPFAMKAVSNVSNFGDVTVRVDDTQLLGDHRRQRDGRSADRHGVRRSRRSRTSWRARSGRAKGGGDGGASPARTATSSITRDAITGATRCSAPAPSTGKRSRPIAWPSIPTASPTCPASARKKRRRSTRRSSVLHAGRVHAPTPPTSASTPTASVVHTLSTNTFADGGSVVSDDVLAVRLRGRGRHPRAARGRR